MRDIVDARREQAANARSILRAEVMEGVVGAWDRMALEQVIENLISNAIKYGEGKPIVVTLIADAGTALLAVRDEGIGIAPQDQERIFGHFERAVTRRTQGGFGVGLWIASRLVRAMRGDIAVASQPGAGATFTVTLPLPGGAVMTETIPRVPSGVPGLDVVLRGGFLRGGLYIIRGAPGAGKTVLANQICYHHAAQGQRALYVTLLAESHARMMLHLGSLTFFDPAKVPDLVYYASGYGTMEEEGLRGLLELLLREVRARQATSSSWTGWLRPRRRPARVRSSRSSSTCCKPRRASSIARCSC